MTLADVCDLQVLPFWLLLCVASYLAPDEAEWPDGSDVDDGGERNTDDDEHEVGGGQPDDEDVGRVAHVLVGDDDDDDRQVADEPEQRDEPEDDGNDDAHQVLEGDVRSVDVLRRTVRRRRRRVISAGDGRRLRIHCDDVALYYVTAEPGARDQGPETARQ